MRDARAIDTNVVARVTVTPCAVSVRRRVSVTGLQPCRASKTMSPPNSERDCSRTERMMLAANESIATSAATPNEIDDMYSSSRRRAVRDSRQASDSSGGRRPDCAGAVTDRDPHRTSR